MQSKDIKKILEKIQSGNYSPEDEEIARYWLYHLNKNKQDKFSEPDLEGMSQKMWEGILEKRRRPAKVSYLFPRVASAASIILVLGAAAYFIINKQKPMSGPGSNIVPFTASAILKSGGKTIELEKTRDGKIPETAVTKSGRDRLTYDQRSTGDLPVYDTIQIPAGGRPYTVKLTDGSRITLNASTILRYPESFSKNRKETIELISGEIYAQVVHHADAPLQIKAPGQIITDVGTEFNVAAYPNDPDNRTTLISGAVKVKAIGKEKLLAPGQQVILTKDDLSVTPADLSEVIAWKEGLFRFNGQRIEVIMRQLSRWYNIEVNYEGKLTGEDFYGRVARNLNIGEVLRILERSNKVSFKVEGRRVTVLSK